MKLRLVDRILWWDANKGIGGLKAASFEEYQLKEAFGGEAALPELLLLQAAYELGGWFIMLASRFTEGGLPAHVGRAEFPSAVRPGERVHLDLELKAQARQTVTMDATGKVGKRAAFAAKGLELRRVALASLGDPDDYRTLFSEISPARLPGEP